MEFPREEERRFDLRVLDGIHMQSEHAPRGARHIVLRDDKKSHRDRLWRRCSNASPLNELNHDVVLVLL